MATRFDNVGPDAQVVVGVSPRTEELIRDQLPPRVKQYMLEYMNCPIPWAFAWKQFQERGEEGMMAFLQRANGLLHVEDYGPSFYQGLSPYRSLDRPV